MDGRGADRVAKVNLRGRWMVEGYSRLITTSEEKSRKVQ